MKSKILFVVSLLTGLLFINGGLNKFFQYMPMPKDLPAKMMEFFQHFMAISWLSPLVAIVEILGGLLLIFSKTRALGAIILLPICIGILCTHFITVQGDYAIPVIISAIIGWIIYENWNKYLPMISE